jgi:hypothetical protein
VPGDNFQYMVLMVSFVSEVQLPVRRRPIFGFPAILFACIVDLSTLVLACRKRSELSSTYRYGPLTSYHIRLVRRCKRNLGIADTAILRSFRRLFTTSMKTHVLANSAVGLDCGLHIWHTSVSRFTAHYYAIKRLWFTQKAMAAVRFSYIRPLWYFSRTVQSLYVPFKNSEIPRLMQTL